MKQRAGAAPSILHLHSTFAAGGKELRCVQLINAFGSHARHTIVSAIPERMEAAKLVSRSVPVTYPSDFPTLQGRPTPGRLHRIAEAMRPYDLVLTYNWGAMDAVMAHTLFAARLGLPPLIHHEDGFNEDERERTKATRNWFRRLALARAQALVVPSEQLEQIALETWHQPITMVHRIANGIDTSAFAKPARGNAIPGLRKQQGDLWVGTLAGLRTVKNLPRLVRAFAALPDNWRLVIVGEGPDKARIEAEAQRLGLADRVALPGFAAQPSRYVGLFDIFALSSDTEQFPISVVEAMAAAIPVASPAVGDVADMVGAENRRFIAAPNSDDALAAALMGLAQDPALRIRIGEANRTKARAQFDEAKMIDAYRRLYWRTMGRAAPQLP